MSKKFHFIAQRFDTFGVFGYNVFIFAPDMQRAIGEFAAKCKVDICALKNLRIYEEEN